MRKLMTIAAIAALALGAATFTSCGGGGGGKGFFDGAEIGTIVSYKTVSKTTYEDPNAPDIIDITIQPYDGGEPKIITVTESVRSELLVRDSYTLVAKNVKGGKAGVFYIFEKKGFDAAREAYETLPRTPRLESEFTPGDGQTAIRSMMTGQSRMEPFEGVEYNPDTGKKGIYKSNTIQRMVWLESGDIVILGDARNSIPDAYTSWERGVQEGRELDVVVSKDNFINLDSELMKVSVSEAVLAVQQAGNIIAADGVGPFKRDAIKPGRVGYYNVKHVTDDPELGNYHYVTDASGDGVLVCYDNGRWEVRSPDFQLKNGIRVGSSLALVQEKMGRAFNPAITMEEWPSPVYLISVADRISLKVGTHQARDLMRGASKFDELKPMAKVEAIYIEK